MQPDTPSPAPLGATLVSTRRDVLRQGRKLAYATPVVIAALRVESAFAASGGPLSGNNGRTGNRGIRGNQGNRGKKGGT